MDAPKCIACGKQARFYADGSMSVFVNGYFLCNGCWDTMEEFLKEHFDEIVDFIKERNGGQECLDLKQTRYCMR